MSSIKIHYEQRNLERKTAEAISDFLRTHSSEPILFLASGGSSLKLLDLIDPAVLGKHITVSVLDERYSADPAVNNFLQIEKTNFYKYAKAVGVGFIDTTPTVGPTGHLESIEDLSFRWGKALRDWEARHHGKRLVVATVGIGPDGHVAGIMPFPEDPHRFIELFEHEAKWTVGYDAGNKNQYSRRITVTISFLKTMVDHAFSYVSGAGKKEMLEAILKKGKLEQHPAFVIHLIKHVDLFTDIKIDTV